jgi:hypothetical protein
VQTGIEQHMIWASLFTRYQQIHRWLISWNRQQAVPEKRRGEVSAFNLNGNMNISRRKN